MSMLYLSCMVNAWPAGIQDMSDLQFLALHCISIQDQDLAVLQHIPHVYLDLRWHSRFLLTSGSWQSLQIRGMFGFQVTFSDADHFVRETKQFYFESRDLYSTDVYEVLRAACTRQGVACHQCEHTRAVEYSGDKKFISLSNVKLCKTHEDGTSGTHHDHKKLLHLHGYWPDRGAYPELYRQDQQPSHWPSRARSPAVMQHECVQRAKSDFLDVFRGLLGPREH